MSRESGGFAGYLYVKFGRCGEGISLDMINN
jgi:hypothetical protein